jgi:hypothetical protein
VIVNTSTDRDELRKGTNALYIFESGQRSASYSEESSWDNGPIDAARLKERSLLYARAAGAGEKLQGEDDLVIYCR